MTVIDLPKIASKRAKRWTTEQYNALVARGALEGENLYLYRGELLEMPAMGALHAFVVSNLTEWLCATFSPTYRIRIQLPFQIPGNSVPQPDGAVVSHAQMSDRLHPQKAELLIEVSDSSLDFDHEKAFDYAAALVPEYWIIDVRTRSVDIYRDPIADASAPLGYRYASHRVAGEEDSIASLLRPDALVSVKSLLATK